MGEELITLAEREYQRRLAALHSTREELSRVDAALRRAAIDRTRLGASMLDPSAELVQRREALIARAGLERRAAQEQRESLQRLRGSVGVEPDELSPELPEAPGAAFVQPPFAPPSGGVV